MQNTVLVYPSVTVQFCVNMTEYITEIFPLPANLLSFVRALSRYKV